MKKIFTLALAALAMVAMSFNAAPPAHAAKADCPAGYTCLWRDTSAQTAGKGKGYVLFREHLKDFAPHNYNQTRFNADNSVTSFFNNGRAKAPYSDAYLYKESYGRGEVWRVSKGEYYWNLAVQTLTWNDTISSGYYYKWVPSK